MSETDELPSDEGEFSDVDREIEERPMGGGDLSDDVNKETDSQSSDEAEFAIVNHEDASGSEGGKGDNSGDEKDFSIINGSSTEVSAEDNDRDIADVVQESEHCKPMDNQKLIDLYGNIGPARQRKGDG